MLLSILLSTAGRAACDHAEFAFVPPEGTTEAPANARVAAIVYGEFDDYEITVDADGKEVFGTMAPTAFQPERPDPGGLLVFESALDFDLEAHHTIHVLKDKVEVASSTFEASSEVARPLSTIPLIQVVDAPGADTVSDDCGERTVHEVVIEITPAMEDPLGMSSLELHLVPEGAGVNDETLYDVLLVPLDGSPVETVVEVPEEGATSYCVSAQQVSGSGEVSGQSTWVCMDDFIGVDDDKKCGCQTATPMGAVTSLLALVAVVSGRRRSRR